jgi:hypothetical protein
VPGVTDFAMLTAAALALLALVEAVNHHANIPAR